MSLPSRALARRLSQIGSTSAPAAEVRAPSFSACVSKDHEGCVSPC